MWVCPECGETRDAAGHCPRDAAELCEANPDSVHPHPAALVPTIIQAEDLASTVPDPRPPRWPWGILAVVVVAAIVGGAAIALVKRGSGSDGGESAAKSESEPTRHKPSPSASAATKPKKPPPSPAPSPTGSAPKGFRTTVDFDPRKFDAKAYLAKAHKLARQLYSDAVLVEFDVSGVYSSGLADLTLSKETDANFWFRSPSRSKRPDGVPEGVEIDIPCMVYVEVNSDKVEVYPATREECKEPRRPTPKCSIREVWNRAIELGAPKSHVAKITYLWDGWFFTIGVDTFTTSIADDC